MRPLFTLISDRLVVFITLSGPVNSECWNVLALSINSSTSGLEWWKVFNLNSSWSFSHYHPSFRIPSLCFPFCA
jgi:hypothetical protein